MPCFVRSYAAILGRNYFFLGAMTAVEEHISGLDATTGAALKLREGYLIPAGPQCGPPWWLPHWLLPCRWGDVELSLPFGRAPTAAEEHIADEAMDASLKLRFKYPKGRVWTKAGYCHAGGAMWSCRCRLGARRRRPRSTSWS